MTNIQFQHGAIDAGGCVSNGWNMIKPNYWLYFGISALVILVSIVLSCIPFVPILVQIFVMPPIMVGIYIVLFREMRGEPIDFGMFFKGFEKYGPALVIGLIQAVPSIIFLILNFSLRLASILPQILQQAGRSGRSNFTSDSDAAPLIAGGVILIACVAIVVGFIFSILWGITFFFALPLVAENEIGAMDAIKLGARAGWSNAGGLILLFIFQGLILLLGVIAICIGIFFVVPVLYAASAFAYRQVFPRIDQPFNIAPPPPTAYGFRGGQYS